MNHRRIASLIGFFIIAAIVGGVRYSQWPGATPTGGARPAEANDDDGHGSLIDKFKITWNPSSVSATIGPGQEQVIPASFTSPRRLRNVVVRVDPELRPFVRVVPQKFDKIERGQTIPLQLIVSALADAGPGTHEGLIRLFREEKLKGKDFSFPVLLARPLPVKVEVWAIADASTEVGVTIAYPPTWYVTNNEDESAVVFRNVEQPGPLSELRFQTESSFHVFRRLGRNPRALPIDEWFAEFSVGGFASDVVSQDLVVVGGRDAVRIVGSESGGDRVHIYVADNTDILEVSYGLYAPQFVPYYDAMLQSISIAR